MTERIHQPERAVIGNCPECTRVIIVLNDHETWPLAVCRCGWKDGITAIVNRTRYERGMPPEREAVG